MGWFQAVSFSDAITGFFTVLNNSVTFLDGADAPAYATKIVFNQARTDSGYATELDIINPDAAAAILELRLSAPGMLPIDRSLKLADDGMARLDVASFFGVDALPPGAYITVSANVFILGLEVVKTPAGDWLALNARTAAERFNTLYFPQMAVLGPWKTDLGIVNYASVPSTITIFAFKPDGTLYGKDNLRENPVVRTLDGNSGMREDVEQLFGFSGTETLDGWITVQSENPSLNGYISYGMPGTGSMAAVSAAAPLSRALCSHLATAQGYFTGLALLNSKATSTRVRVLAFRVDGTLLGYFDTVLQSGQRISKLINELIPQSDNQAGGFIWIKSDIPISATSLFGSAGVLANIPLQTAPQTYNPDAKLPPVF
jgi:hypothetical protein